MHVSLLLLFSPLLVLAQIQLSGLTNTLPTEPTSSLQIDYTITSGDAKTAGIVIGNTYIPFTNPKVGGKVVHTPSLQASHEEDANENRI